MYPLSGYIEEEAIHLPSVGVRKDFVELMLKPIHGG